MKFVAVTSCPTGIAHTYMAAEALETAAANAGHEIEVETQGAGGFTPLDPAVIAAADAVIFAADVEVRDRERFAGKPTVTTSVKSAIHDAPALIIEAANETTKTPVPAAGAGGGAAGASAGLAAKNYGHSGIAKVRGWLMTGVSYMIPFVAAGGILIAIAFMLSQIAWGETGVVAVTEVPLDELIANFSVVSLQDWAAMLFLIGAAAFGFLVPILSGFIAFGIADRPGIAPGIVGGFLAVEIGSGFLGGIVTGVIAGFAALWISRWKVPSAIRSIMPVVVTPLLATLITGALMIILLGRPLAAVSDGLTEWLNSMSDSSAILLGVILGLMMAFDMGGPVNKVAYSFAAAGLATVGASTDAPQLTIMAAVMAAGMVPPLGLALATTLRKRLFSEAEQENGKAAWLLGASFITEGAIPFAAADPIRVIPSLMAGSAVTGGLVMAFDNTLRAPHGGIWVLPLIGGPLTYLLAIAIGTVVTAGLVITLKGLGRTREDIAVEGEVKDAVTV
ncbi:MAG: PTS fructose transporter subunit IIBC [Actinobacteria bacterium]|nr:PTS fructose transporter subunit IIBC [Actinomycetota bacterium]